MRRISEHCLGMDESGFDCLIQNISEDLFKYF